MPFHVFQQTQQVQDLAISSELVEFLSSSGSDVVISRNLLVNEDVFLNQDLQVNGTTTIQGPCSVNGTTTIGGSCSVNGTTTINGPCSVNGTTTINGSCSANSIGTTGEALTLLGQKVHVKHPTTSERYLEIGNNAANISYLDFHSADSSSNDYNARIQSVGGNTNTGSGSLTLIASSINLQGALQINGASLTPTATEYNTLAGATPGTAVASKALVCNASTNISGLGTVGAKMFVRASTATNTNITLSDTYSVYIVDTSSGAISVRLPAGPASFTGRMWTVIRADTGTANNLTINGAQNSVTHNGALPPNNNNPSNLPYKMFTVFCDGSSYYSW